MNLTQLGALIKYLRKNQNMTQDDLAEQLDVSVSAVSKWETGKNLPDMDVLHRLSTIFHISIDDLYHAEDTLSALTTPNTDNITIVPKQKVSIHHTLSLKKLLVVLGIFTLMLLSIVGINILSSNSPDSEQEIRQVAYRITEDKQCGTVYEVACIYTGSLESITLTSPFLVQLSDFWLKDTSIDSHIITMKVSLYDSEEDYLHWDTPNKSYYLIR